MCTICFLTDKQQYLLRHSSMIRSDRFEHTLENYCDEFINKFYETNYSLCSKHENDINIKIINSLKEIDKASIITFFRGIRKVYIDWINASLSTAITNFSELLNKYKLINFKCELSNEVFFRCRESEIFISHWDMFHIPFNKRFLIGNQRYSLTGQPILYFSTSPDTDTNTITNTMINYELLQDSHNIISMFYLLILSSCCSFPRRNVTTDIKDSKFVEEYVLPQILTATLKDKKLCDGIKYTSTKSYIDSLNNSPTDIKTKLYSNYCIFTNYEYHDYTKIKDVYDRNLYNKFIISNPINFTDSINENLYNLDDILYLIDDIDSNNGIPLHYKNISYELGDYLKLLTDFIVNNPSLKELETKFINLHILFARNILLNIKDFKEVNYE